MLDPPSATHPAKVEATQPLPQALLEQGWTSWAEAGLGPCLTYVWGSKLDLAIPEEWRAYDAAARTKFDLSRFRGFAYLG